MVSLLLAIIYLTFISLGLPGSLLGAAWPVIYPEIQVPISYSGIIFFIISIGTVIASLQSDRLIKKLSAGKMTMLSVALTAVGLLGFSFSSSFFALCLWAIPYGFGAGGIDSTLNNYVALHYKSSHMSWLHCMWGVGATIGPYIMSRTIASTASWHRGYFVVGLMQVTMTFILFISLPLWTKKEKMDEAKHSSPVKTDPIPLKEIIKTKGAKEILITFFAYCAVEQTVALWAASYLVVERGVSEEMAASFASLFFLGITIGRAINGFLTYKFTDNQLINIGHSLMALGIILLYLPFSTTLSLMGFLIIGFGCAPIFPSIIHSTPSHFGRDKSQAMVGVQMASAFLGTSIMPPFFGFLTRYLGLGILPVFLILNLIIEIVMYSRLQKVIV